jgi:type IV secretory pathway TraG/TraD family ATPase VirD4
MNNKLSDSVFARWLALNVAFGGLWFLRKNLQNITAHAPQFLSQLVGYVPREDFLLFIYVGASLTLFTWNKTLTKPVILWKSLGQSLLGAMFICIAYFWYATKENHFWIFFIFPFSWFGGFSYLKAFYQARAGSGDGEEILKRGKSILSLYEARKISDKKIVNDGPGVNFGWIRVPESQATTHFAIIGSTGSGKTIIIRSMMESILPRISTGQDLRALIYDAKRDMIPILVGQGMEEHIISLHPFDERGSAWDMAKDITSPAAADQAATVLIPHEKGSSNPFFTDAARALMTGVMTVFIRKCSEKWTFRDVIVALKSATRIKTVLGECDETKDLIEQYFTNERTANDVMATLATKIQRYQYVAAAWEKAKESISLKEWMQSESILVLGNDEEARSAIDALNQVIFKRVSELILNQSESFSRRTWIFLDELKEAGELPGLTSLLSKGRSKGACVVIGFQDIEGLSAAMRDSRVAHEIVGLCANKAVLRLDSAETAKWASAQFGEQEIEQKRVSTSSGKSTQEGTGSRNSSNTSTSEQWINMKRQAILPAQFLDLKPVEKTGALHGYYIVPSIGTYGASIKMSGEDSILEGMKKISEETPGYCARPKEDQYLRLWDEADLKRLGLKSLTTSDGYTKTQMLNEEKEQEEEQEVDPLDMIRRS